MPQQATSRLMGVSQSCSTCF